MKPLELIENVLLPALILAAGVVVVQAHAIPYWQATMGAAVGLVASLGAELVGLYLVYQPGRLARATGLALILVMVLVPAWVICGPEYSAWRQASAQRERAAETQATAPGLIAALEQDIAAAERSLREDEAKSAVRAGWLDSLERQREALTALRAQRRALIEARDAPAAAGYDAWAALPKVLPVLALLLAFQLANAGAVLRMSGWRFRGASTASAATEAPAEAPEAQGGMLQTPLQNERRSAEAPLPAEAPEAKRRSEAPASGPPDCEAFAEAPGPPEAPEAPEAAEAPEAPEAPEALGANDLLVKRLQRAVVQRKDELGSGRAVCREHGINDRDYTWLMKHFARRKAGQPTISEAKLRELAARFLPADAGAGADG